MRRERTRAPPVSRSGLSNKLPTVFFAPFQSTRQRNTHAIYTKLKISELSRPHAKSFSR